MIYHQEGHFRAHDDLRICYQAWQPETTLRAVLIVNHGMGEHSGRYQNYVDYFAPRGYALYGLDMRGCGRSDGRRGHADRFDDFLEDLKRLHDIVRAAHPGRATFLLGHSFGSLVALMYGLRQPDGLGGVISSGTALRDALPYPGWARAIIRLAGRALPTVAVPSGLKAAQLSRDAAVVEAYRRDPLVHGVGTLRWASEAIVARDWLLAHAGEWWLPLLMLHGSSDGVCLKEGARLFRAQIAAGRAEHHEYEGMYHEVHNETGREEVFRDVEEWLGRMA